MRLHSACTSIPDVEERDWQLAPSGDHSIHIGRLFASLVGTCLYSIQVLLPPW